MKGRAPTRPLARDLEAALQRALAHHRAGRLDEAAKGYDAVLARAPRTAPALAMKGLLLLQRGRAREAIAQIERSLALDPTDASGWSNLGHALRLVGRTEEAVAACRRAVALEPARAEAHNNLGNALRDRGELVAAEDAFARALNLAPTLFAAAANLAHVRARQAPAADVLESVEVALTLGEHARPRDRADLHNLRGNVLRRAGRAPEAIESYRAAIAIEPTFAEALINLGRTLAQELALEEAVEPLARGLALRPSEHAVHPQLALVLRRLGRETEAAAVYRAWHLAAPDDPVAAHLAASSAQRTDATSAPPRASADYVRREFDGFARSFDEVLVERLGYRGPELVGEALTHAGLLPDASLDVLDAGCGTGLGAPQLRPLARRLVGVDLSSEMLRHAATRGAYDELVEADVLDHAERARDTYDLVTATEVLLYFGDLEAPLCGLAAALRTGGRLVVTIEAADAGVTRWTLGPSGRYAHAHAYLREALTAAALVVETLEPVVLRRELGVDVHGWLAVARREAHASAPTSPPHAAGSGPSE